jgi:hypothetical protein
VAQNERRTDRRDRLRQARKDALAELYEADDDEETSPEVVADVAARTAARTARQLSRPDSDGPERVPFLRTPAARGGGIVTIIALVVAGIIAGLRQAGILK